MYTQPGIYKDMCGDGGLMYMTIAPDGYGLNYTRINTPRPKHCDRSSGRESRAEFVKPATLEEFKNEYPEFFI